MLVEDPEPGLVDDLVQTLDKCLALLLDPVAHVKLGHQVDVPELVLVGDVDVRSALDQLDLGAAAEVVYADSEATNEVTS